ncbi:hypothetical protein KQ313_11865 [Synechococcus sp. CS-1325]|uniref:hypothetical protein n=1 Tax=unclassified Synechococcus TaxID=2626047 RepID=UPI000DB1C5A1|nr:MULTISPECIES: hypothetical protein [unclassified Synechococcus]PZU97029.1 MAG: hypothetical protein DCF24_12870 [Cyanobium sp.]MCT0200373.1 hypothetical protein [Synechococcus sp. CS-1325]MCT0213987.1 hypothetical protein [Synechococcus sp. CS-1326]MCT0230053.1 hypothetical protein [Synechococcus sp. CS-1324]MCT0233563.1 hypothetical protein [Synechococcus sp. CS-1327]
MALDRFKQALTALMIAAPSDPLDRDEYFEVTPLPAADGPFELVVVDEENGIFAALYLDRLFQEDEAGQEEVALLLPGYLEETFGLEPSEWVPTAPFDLGWRSREFLWFLEFSLPGLTPACHSDA